MEKEINENIIEIEGKKYKFIEAEKSICCRSCDLRKDRRCHLLHRMCIPDNRKDKKEGYFKRIEETTMENKNTIKKKEVEKTYKYLIGKNVQKTENSVYKITDVKYRIHPNFEYLELQCFYIYHNEINKEILINSDDWESRSIEYISPYLENRFISDKEFNEVLDKAINAMKKYNK